MQLPERARESPLHDLRGLILGGVKKWVERASGGPVQDVRAGRGHLAEDFRTSFGPLLRIAKVRGAEGLPAEDFYYFRDVAPVEESKVIILQGNCKNNDLSKTVDSQTVQNS